MDDSYEPFEDPLWANHVAGMIMKVTTSKQFLKLVKCMWIGARANLTLHLKNLLKDSGRGDDWTNISDRQKVSYSFITPLEVQTKGH